MRTLGEALACVLRWVSWRRVHEKPIVKVGDLVSSREVVEKLLASTAEGAVRELVARAGRPGLSAAIHKTESGKPLLDRIQLSCGRGLALLRVAHPIVSAPFLLVGRSTLGLSFPGGDDSLVHVVLLFVGNSRPSRDERAVQTRLAASLSLRESVDALLSCQVLDQFREAFARIDAGLSAAPLL